MANPQTSTPSTLGSSVFEWSHLIVQPTANGARRALFNASTATLERLSCHATTLNVGETSHPPHRHANEELVVVKEGTLEVTINGEAQRAGPGSVIFYASNDLHGMRNAGETPATYYVFLWTPSTPPVATAEASS